MGEANSGGMGEGENAVRDRASEKKPFGRLHPLRERAAGDDVVSCVHQDACIRSSGNKGVHDGRPINRRQIFIDSIKILEKRCQKLGTTSPQKETSNHCGVSTWI